MNKNILPLRTVDGAALMSQPLRPPNFVVDTLLAQGLHILAGSPKVGNSWLALWLSVMVAKGELVWGMSVKQGTTLYLCLEDSVLRIQNRLFEITEDAPSSVHFCTECDLIGQGLEEQVETFLTAHPDTVLVIIDTLQMVRPARDATYANDYRDLSALKRIADAHGIAILLIHHLRKETADDVFNRISGTTAISGAVDSSFTLVEERRGSRDIEYRELTLERNGENVWELVSDSRTQPELLGDRIVYLLSELMRDRTEFIGTPTDLSERIDPVGVERISPKKVSRQILQNLDALSKIGISVVVRRSNGKRLIGLRRAGSDHRKYIRQVFVSVDITAPMYWWKEYDTYKVATVANSTSTMHKIHSKPFELDDFSHDHLTPESEAYMQTIVDQLEKIRLKYVETKDKAYWYDMIQLLPSSYNQMRTCTLNYETLINIYFSRKNHKLDEWHTFCDWIKTLPYAKELILAEEEEA